MALLHYNNLDVARPDILLKNAFYGLKTFHDFLRRTKDYMEGDAAVKRLAWKAGTPPDDDQTGSPRGFWIQLEEPRDRPNEPESTFRAFMDENVRDVFERIADDPEARADRHSNGRKKFADDRRLLVLDRDPETSQLLVDRLPKGEELLLRPNTLTLQRQIASNVGEDHAVVKRLCTRAREGVDVTVLARIRPSSMPALLALAKAGANVLGFRWLHAKAIWTDAGQSMVMSANLQSDGLDHGFELGIRLSDGRSHEMRERLEGWCAAAPWRLEHQPLLGALQGQVKSWKQGQLADAEIVTSIDVDLGAVTAESAVAIEAGRPRLPAETASPSTLAHELRCVWLVAAPSLAAKAKEQLRPAAEKDQPGVSYQPPVFREPSGRLVVAVRSVAELDQARVVMGEVGAATIVVAEGAN